MSDPASLPTLSAASILRSAPRDPADVERIERSAGASAGLLDSAAGELRFAPAEERDGARARLEREGLVVVELEGIGPSARGRLGALLDESIERELDARGAAGPAISGSGDADASLGDQLFRARRLGAPGIALVLGPMRAAVDELGALDPRDGRTLRFLARACRERPLMVLLDERDALTPAYGRPEPLHACLGVPASPSLQSPTPPPEPSTSLTRPVAALAPASPVPAQLPPSLPAPLSPRHAAGSHVVERDEAWRSWTLQLAAARGPQPLASLERLFAESYVPLANAVGAGLDDPRARAAEQEFRATFAKSYAETFPTFAVKTKRPRMVFDAHDIASRIARLHGARSVRLLLVDAMRWDLSRLIEERVAMRLGVRASLTDELVLWSALPTTTMRQLETIARGLEALRSPADLEPDADPTRGRTAEYVRRLRVGARELHKLDVVEARLQAARGNVLRALPEIADSAADAIVRHAEALAPRTLLFVFGDHGFTVDRSGCAQQGGASPEEVLVGAFALLVGDVH